MDGMRGRSRRQRAPTHPHRHKYIGKLERGMYRWPSRAHRQALRTVLGASTDAELGFYISRDQPSAGRQLPGALSRPHADGALIRRHDEPRADRSEVDDLAAMRSLRAVDSRMGGSYLYASVTTYLRPAGRPSSTAHAIVHTALSRNSRQNPCSWQATLEARLAARQTPTSQAGDKRASRTVSRVVAGGRSLSRWRDGSRRLRNRAPPRTFPCAASGRPAGPSGGPG
jgi:hypothetical protein